MMKRIVASIAALALFSGTAFGQSVPLGPGGGGLGSGGGSIPTYTAAPNGGLTLSGTAFSLGDGVGITYTTPGVLSLFGSNTNPVGDGAGFTTQNSTLTASQIYSGNLLPALPGYTNFDNVRSVLNLQPATGVKSAVVASGGSGGTPGAGVNLTVTGGTCSVQPVIQGTISGGGALTAITGYGTPGTCTVAPSNPATVTAAGPLSGATITINYGNIVNTAFNAYTYNDVDFTTEPYGVSSVAYKASVLCVADNSQCWSINTNSIDSLNTTLNSGTGRILDNWEDDNVVTSPDTIVQGITPTLIGPAQPKASTAIQVAELSTTATLTGITISNGSGGAGTIVSATVVSGAPVNGNLIEGGSVTVGTTLSSVSVVAGTLTATASISQNTSGSAGATLTAPVTAQLTGISIAGTALTATVVAGTPLVGNIVSGAGITANTTLSTVSVVAGALTATVNNSQTVGPVAGTAISPVPTSWQNGLVIGAGAAQDVIISQYLPYGNTLHSIPIDIGVVNNAGTGSYMVLEAFPLGAQPGLEIWNTVGVDGLVIQPGTSGNALQTFVGGPNAATNANWYMAAAGSGTLNFGSSAYPNSTATFTGTVTGNTTLTVSGVSGTIIKGQTLGGAGVTPGTVITAGSGSSWTISSTSNVGPIAMSSAQALGNPLATFEGVWAQGYYAGTAGSVAGSLTLYNATSGSITLAPTTGALGTVTATLPANTGTVAELNLAQTVTALQSYTGGIAFPDGTAQNPAVLLGAASASGANIASQVLQFNYFNGSSAEKNYIIKVNVSNQMLFQTTDTTGLFLFNGNTFASTHVSTAAAATVAAGQIGYGGTTAAASNCNVTSPTPTGCVVINVAGTTRYLPYY